MKKVTTILLLLMSFTSSLFSTKVYSQTNQGNDIKSSNTITPKSYAFSKGSFILGTNLSYGYSNENFYPTNNSSIQNSQAYGLNLNAGYMLSKYTKLSANFDRNIYYYDGETTKNSNYSYGLSVSQYLLTDRFTPFITLSSSFIDGKRIEDNYNITNSYPYNGYNIIFSAGMIYYIVNNFYLQGNINLISYHNLDYTLTDIFSNTTTTVNNQQFLVGLSQPISLGVFYNLTSIK